MRDNAAMGGSGEGRRHAASGKPSSGPLPYVLAMLLGAALSAVAWFYLVRAAIDFGTLARDGHSDDWRFTAIAALGAVACMLLVLILVGRALTALGIISGYRPRRAAAHRRAK